MSNFNRLVDKLIRESVESNISDEVFNILQKMLTMPTKNLSPSKMKNLIAQVANSGVPRADLDVAIDSLVEKMDDDSAVVSRANKLKVMLDDPENWSKFGSTDGKREKLPPMV
jgi:hypothetical protein